MILWFFSNKSSAIWFLVEKLRPVISFFCLKMNHEIRLPLSMRQVNLHPDIKNIRWTWYFLGYGSLKNIRCINPIFFRFWLLVLTIFSLLSIWNLKKKRPSCLSSFWIKQKSIPCFFQVPKPTQFFKTKIVATDWLGDSFHWN